MSKTKQAQGKATLHDLKQLATLPQYSIDISATVDALLTPFSAELAAADVARAHKDEGYMLMDKVKAINTQVNTMRDAARACETEAQRLLAVINAAENTITAALEQNERYRHAKIWMRENNKAEEFDQQIAVQREALLLDIAGKEMAERQAALDECSRIRQQIAVLGAEADTYAEVARKEFAEADAILLEAGFNVPAKK